MSAWTLSCLDWQDRLRLGKTLVPSLPGLDMVQANRAVSYFNALRLPDVTGTPLMRDACGDWFRDIVAALFGSWDEAEKTRYIKELFCMVPKKNSKTTNSAALMIVAMLMNKRPQGECVLVAPTKEIAGLAFRQATGMIRLDPFLSQRFHIQDHLKTVTDNENRATLKILSADISVVTGCKPFFALIDELHVMSMSGVADQVIGQLKGGMISQPEAMLVTITTQSERPPAGVFKAELNQARKVRDGLMQAPILPVLYELPEGTDWRDESNWPMVLPNLGRSINIDALRTFFVQAQEKGEEEVRRWASQHLNVEIGTALRYDRWAGAEFWGACADTSLTLQTLLERCEVVVVGIDGGGLDDLLGLAVLGRCRETGDWLLWCHAWAHEIALERRKEISQTLRDFERDGDLTIVKTPGKDVEQVAAKVRQVRDAGVLPEENGVGVDAAGIGEIVDAMVNDGDGIEMGCIVGVAQGWKLNGAIKTAERKVASRQLRHSGTAMMSWCVGNAKVQDKGNGVAITKQDSGKAKIDPLMAVFNAVHLMALDPQAPEFADFEEVYAL